jgi:hypothetical protein
MQIGFTPAAPLYNNEPANLIQTDPVVQGTIREHTAAGVREKNTVGIKDCETCKNRTYQDQSSDGGVSMQSPTHIPPEMSGSAVMSHEREHASRDAAQAKIEGREVISSSIRLFTSTCAECGKIYVSGGESRTVTGKRDDEPQYGALHQPGQIMDLLM